MVIIAFEGKSDGEFFNSLLDEYGLDKTRVTYYNFRGKDNIFNIGHEYYDEIEKKYLSKLEKILFVVDADNDKDPNPNRGFEASKKALKQLIDDLGFDEVSIDYYIMCDEKREGNLESFLLSILDDEQKECIDNFKECYKYELTDKWAYNTFYKQKKEPFDFNHQNFDKLREKLEKLYEEQQ
ncbi:MAG: hypothetical protein LGB54_01825 [Sulfurovum sp.]|nr:hypothetical protein [Sulfurovum sp.]MCB4762825.1 hypothetical protein [Sulfurovum sp.]MCB4778486.1 hypothetical protein [Sulfurovum sp.]MCB4782011.1 hypothetical protein [Sulfurovum sp.]MCB4784635.1 hypothetical protein [Sulfurovum sp.]